MKFFASKRTQRGANFVLAAMLVFTTMTASVPFLFSQNASAATGYAYKGIPAVQPSTYPSLGYEATSTTEFGDRIVLGGDSTARQLDTVTFSLTSWACQTGGWNTNDCVTTEGATFSHPVTVNFYNTDPTGTVGTLITSKTETVTAKYRPSADLVNCTGGNLGKWFDGTNCNNGIAFDTTFDFTGEETVLPNEVIATVAYSTVGNGPFDSLNFSLTGAAPTVGTDVDSDVMYWATTYPGYTGSLVADTGWSPYRLAMDISTSQIVVPTPTNIRLTRDSDSSVVPTGSTVNYTGLTMKWDTVPNAERYQIRVTDPAGATQANRYTGFYTFDLNDATRHGFFGTQQGEWKYEVRTKDATFGLWSEWSTPLSLTFDSQKPTVLLTSPTQTIFNNSQSLVIDAADNLGLNKVVANVYQGVSPSGVLYKPTQVTAAAGAVALTHTVSLDGLPEGNYYVKYNATDKTGALSTTKTFSFTIDNTAPTYAIKPGTSFTIGADDVFSKVSFTLSDAQQVDKITINSTETDFVNATTVDVDGITAGVLGALEGSNTLVIYDVAGNTTTYTFTIDTIAPAVEITAPSNGAIFGNNFLVNIIGSTDSAVSYVFTIGQVGQPPLVNTNGSSFAGYNWDTTGVLSGDYTITLFGTDGAGNTSLPFERVITIDNTAPAVTIAPQTSNSGNQPTITGTVDDENATLVASFNGVSGIAVLNNAGTFSFAAPAALANGTYVFTIEATDVFGNATVQTANVIVAVATPTSPPTTTVTPIITSPAAAAVLGEATDADQAAQSGGATDVQGVTDKKVAAAANSDANNGTIFGVAWYWWILIIAGLGALSWFIISAVRGRQAE